MWVLYKYNKFLPTNFLHQILVSIRGRGGIKPWNYLYSLDCSFMYFVGRAIHEFKIPTKYLFTLIILHIIEIHEFMCPEHVQIPKTTKFSAHEMISQYVIFQQGITYLHHVPGSRPGDVILADLRVILQGLGEPVLRLLQHTDKLAKQMSLMSKVLVLTYITLWWADLWAKKLCFVH